MSLSPLEKIANLKPLIGNTPLAEISFTYKGEPRKIYAKLESFNMSGSIKDRMAYKILQKSYENGALKPNDTIIEATSGNTGDFFFCFGTCFRTSSGDFYARLVEPGTLSNY